jgi:ribA/ribD-fused uncharacterized protein
MINDFHGECFFLSNFYESPLWYNGKLWHTVEHAFQAAKVDDETAEKIYKTKSPGEAKRLGRQGKMRPDWDEIRFKVMEECLMRKFLCNPELLQKLLDTGDEKLIEGNTWHDNTWGDCNCPKCANKHGMNMLGKTLMNIRQLCQEGRIAYAAKLYDKNSVGEIKCYFKEYTDAVKYLHDRKDNNGEICKPDDRHLLIIVLR